jgi:Rrf2 family protein
MKLSKTSEYALRVLAYMINSDMQVFTAKHLVETLDVPNKYLRRLMTDMSKHGFIKSMQGREGGYVFARNADKIFLNEVIDAVEGIDKYQGCIMGHHKCSDENPCSLHKSYAPLRDSEMDYFRRTSIKELKDNNVHKF